jgi:hypothetical protein
MVAHIPPVDFRVNSLQTERTDRYVTEWYRKLSPAPDHVEGAGDGPRTPPSPPVRDEEVDNVSPYKPSRSVRQAAEAIGATISTSTFATLPVAGPSSGSGGLPNSPRPPKRRKLNKDDGAQEDNVSLNENNLKGRRRKGH